MEAVTVCLMALTRDKSLAGLEKFCVLKKAKCQNIIKSFVSKDMMFNDLTYLFYIFVVF